MAEKARAKSGGLPMVGKSPTGIHGLDEVTQGGLPQGRPTLLCGSAGCGKTLFAMTFLYKGVVEYNEPGVFIAFEERPEDLIKNVGSLNYDIERLIAEKKLAIDHIEIERTKIEESGEYDLEGLFIRLGFAIDSVGAKRVVIDTIETLFSGLENELLLRSELRRLFEWLKVKGVTAIITAERGEGTLTRYGLEEYVADCVILLDNRVNDQLSTRRLRVVKYRGSAHGTNEYPFIIDEQGITVMPITSSGLAHDASTERVSSGIPDLDTMLEGKGYYKGASILVSGMAGSGKSTVSAHFANSVCESGQRCIYFAMEESPHQIIRNMRSVGLDLEKWVNRKLLKFSCAAAEPLRPRDSPRGDAPRGDRFRSRRGRRRSDVGADERRRDRGRAFDGASAGRLSQGPCRHGFVHQSRHRSCRDRRHRNADFVAYGHVAATLQSRGQWRT